MLQLVQTEGAMLGLLPGSENGAVMCRFAAYRSALAASPVSMKAWQRQPPKSRSSRRSCDRVQASSRTRETC